MNGGCVSSCNIFNSFLLLTFTTNNTFHHWRPCGNSLFTRLNCMLLVQPRWFDLSLRVCGHDIRPVFHTGAATKRVFLPLRLCISPQQVNWERTVVEEGRRGRDMGIKKINSLTFCFCQFPVVAPLLSLLFPSFALSPVSDESFLEG